jgi:polyhydroxybutyrate depolymerase
MAISLRTPLFLCSLILSIASPACAEEGTLRERIRERRAERQQQKAEAVQPVTTAGDYSFSLVHGGLTRKYLVHVPKGYDPNRAAPVLVALHGGGGNMEFQADDANYGLITKSESASFIAVFPNGYSPFPGGKLATWNAGNCCGASRDKDIDDVGFVRAVVAQVQLRLNVDATRIYATGMSNGGMLAHRLACEAADVFAGVAAVAGTDNTRSCTPSRPIPVLQVHARNDDHVLFEGGAGPNAFRDESKVTAFTSVPETIARWSKRNGCSGTPSRGLEVPGAYCERQSNCSGGAPVQLCVTDTGGHSWPGAARVRGSKAPASKALSANDVMWDFFARR